MSFSVFLPRTSFAMKGDLARQEPLWLEWWEKIGLYQHRREMRKGCDLFMVQDGPPYANGPIHLGHALNKTLKDFIGRWRFLQGYDVAFVPGWDCHGLPIENQIEKELANKGKKRQDIAIPTFRQECQRFAAHWVQEQEKGFRRLGVVADWAHPALTMAPAFQARIMAYFFQMLQEGHIYRGLRPVLWSPVEQTALAEAEVEYHNVRSNSLYVRFPLKKAPLELLDVSAVIWTTTPWSLPANRALTYAENAEYGLYEVQNVDSSSQARIGEKLLIAQECWTDFCHKVGITQGQLIRTFHGTALAGWVAAHPWHTQDTVYDFDVPFLPSEHVCTDSGTGLVHTAPVHGLEDFIIGKRYQLPNAYTLSPQGIFLKEVPLVGGMHMSQAYDTIVQTLQRCGTLMGCWQHEHNYPHSWRSKTPLFHYATLQWFIALDGMPDFRTKLEIQGKNHNLADNLLGMGMATAENSLRDQALHAIRDVNWVPDIAYNRMSSMLSSRPDWCISRQRVWGVPIAVFLHKETSEILKDERIFQRIQERTAREGCDFWFTQAAYEVLEGLYEPEDWVKNEDIIDVWFESGLTSLIVNRNGLPNESVKPLPWPLSLYLEGSDQHRAWFQSSLMLSVALAGCAPYKTVLTHGFVLDAQGRKMSKSLGNVVDPMQVIETKGADLLRLWVISGDYQQDIRFGLDIIARVEDIYRRFRNTLRYLLSNLQGWSMQEMQPVQSMNFLNRWIHHRLYQVHSQIKKSLETYDFQAILQTLSLFCSQDLSTFYFDICKDSLYCDALDNQNRMEIRTSFWHIFLHLVHWLSPVLCFTSEEAWHCFGKEILKMDPDSLMESSDKISRICQEWGLDVCSLWSIHARVQPAMPQSWYHPLSEPPMDAITRVRDAIFSVLEKARKEQSLRQSTEAFIDLYVDQDLYRILSGFPEATLAQYCLVAGIALHQDTDHEEAISVIPAEIALKWSMAPGGKCKRCWSITPEVTSDEPLCHRCVEVVNEVGLR